MRSNRSGFVSRWRPPTGKAETSKNRLLPPILASVPLLAGSCTAAFHEAKADRLVSELLDATQSRTLGGYEESAVYPELAAPEVPETPDPSGTGDESETEAAAPDVEAPMEMRELSLADALRLGVDSNRDYQSQIEGLYLAALALVDARHVFSPQLSLILSYLFSDGDFQFETQDAGAILGITQELPWGGRLSINADTGYLSVSGDGEFDSGASISLTQPLLRDAGYEASHELLVQTERNLIYAIRDFELFREDFSIEVATRFYALVGTRRQIENQRDNLADFVFDRRRAEALFEVGRSKELDVLRARRSELNSRNALIEAEEGYQEALDRFRIFLGLAATFRFDVAPEEPEFVEVLYDSESAVEVALVNRLDVLNRRGRLEDTERAVRLARNDLLPDLTLDLTYGRDTDLEASFLDQQFDTESFSAGLTFDAPVDRVFERSSYRRTQILHARNQRDYEEFVDGVAVDVQSAFRELNRRRQSLDIQRELIRDEERNVRIARLRFEQGTVSNRDVVEAQQSLLDARNELIQEQVNYEIVRLRLLRNLGILFIDENGMWKE